MISSLTPVHWAFDVDITINKNVLSRGVLNTHGGEYDAYHEYDVTNSNIYS